MMFVNSKTKSRRIQTSSVSPSALSTLSSPWGSVRTRSDPRPEQEQEHGETNQAAKMNKASEANQWQSVHPFEVLRGRPNPVAANHSHFQWGESVTRSPAHPVRHK